MKVSWKTLCENITTCTACPLHKTRTNVAIEDGSRHSKIMLVGEGPGQEEDRQGIPFVGPAGQLLNKMLASIDLTRKDVYICNIVKCRPPNNRTPAIDEAQICLPFLRAQYVLIQPRVILCLGATAAKYVLDYNIRITRDRGVWHEKNGVFMLATYHPAALLRDESKKSDAWADMCSLRDKIQELGLLSADEI